MSRTAKHLTAVLVSEVIALKLRRDNKSLPYVYTQIFAGVTYLIAGALISVLAVIKRRDHRGRADELQLA